LNYIRISGAINKPVPKQWPNPPMQSTPLRGPKIVAILKSAFELPAVPIYKAARLMGIPLSAVSMVSVPIVSLVSCVVAEPSFDCAYKERDDEH
jgi:hypothetical protein